MANSEANYCEIPPDCAAFPTVNGLWRCRAHVTLIGGSVVFFCIVATSAFPVHDKTSALLPTTFNGLRSVLSLPLASAAKGPNPIKDNPFRRAAVAAAPEVTSLTLPTATVKVALVEILQRIEAALKARNADDDAIKQQDCELVAVSKTKPVELLQAAYNCGQRRFGENYAEELLEKAPLMPPDVRWHFIGHLNTRKARKLVEAVPNLAVVETVHSLKLAKKLNDGCLNAGQPQRNLTVYIQVKTSDEDTKFGVTCADAVVLAKQIASECAQLRVAGLMTIGAPGDLTCFDQLVECRAAVAAALEFPSAAHLALSMGMSNDFEEAIARGATSVRVGSSIFGARHYPAQKLDAITVG